MLSRLNRNIYKIQHKINNMAHSNCKTVNMTKFTINQIESCKVK